MYQKQSANVRWEGRLLKQFNISNGVKQGAVLSPILFCFYMNNLFSIMKNNKTGCHVGNYFAGLFGYADDLFIISPSRKGLQEMVSAAEKYAYSHNIKFSTNPDPVKSKTKGIIFRKYGGLSTKSSSFATYKESRNKHTSVSDTKTVVWLLWPVSKNVIL